MSYRRIFTLFAKAPINGQVKTRLISTLGEAAATTLYEKLLQRTIQIAEQVTLDARILSVAEEPDLGYFQNLPAWQLSSQQGNTIGQRMAGAFRSWASKDSSLVLIGADVADVEPDDIAQAYRMLDSGFDVVLGPSDDGGYWLIASRRAELPVFSGICWSSGRVFSQTRLKLRRHGLSYFCLPIRHDIDEPKDLRHAANLLQAD